MTVEPFSFVSRFIRSYCSPGMISGREEYVLMSPILISLDVVNEFIRMSPIFKSYGDTA